MSQEKRQVFGQLLSKLESYLLSIGFVEVQKYKGCVDVDTIIAWLKLNAVGANLDELEIELRQKYNVTDSYALSTAERNHIKRILSAMIELVNA